MRILHATLSHASLRIASVRLLRAEVGRRHVVMCHTHTSLWIARTRLSRQHFTPLVTTPSGARTVLSDNPVRGRVSSRLSPSHTTCLSQSGFLVFLGWTCILYYSKYSMDCEHVVCLSVVEYKLSSYL